MNVLILMSALIVGLITIFLVVHSHYEDGLFGRIALAAMSISQWTVFIDGAFEKTDYSAILPTTIMLQFGICLFFMRHLYRFIRNRKTGEYDWRPARK